MKTDYKISLNPRTLENAEAKAQTIISDTQKAMGMIPNMYLTMANSPGMLSTYMHGYKFFREESGFTPPEQEVVFLAISISNQCEYCVAAHSFVGDKMTKVPAEITEAIRAGKTLPDAKLEALRAFTTTVVEKRGWISKQDADAFASAGYTERHILEIILAVAVKTLSNYSNHLFHTVVDDAFAGRKWQAPG